MGFFFHLSGTGRNNRMPGSWIYTMGRQEANFRNFRGSKSMGFIKRVDIGKRSGITFLFRSGNSERLNFQVFAVYLCFVLFSVRSLTQHNWNFKDWRSWTIMLTRWQENGTACTGRKTLNLFFLKRDLLTGIN